MARSPVQLCGNGTHVAKQNGSMLKGAIKCRHCVAAIVIRGHGPGHAINVYVAETNHDNNIKVDSHRRPHKD